MSTNERLRAVVVAGHRGDVATVARHLDDDDPHVREATLGALDRMGALTAAHMAHAVRDDAPVVRRRIALLLATRPGTDLLPLLHDDDTSVVEVAAWACGEHETVDDATLERLIELAGDARDALVRESAAAALGAIGDERGLPAILAACDDKPQVRRRAVLALAPFDGEAVDAALDRALEDRDWQVRQAAEDLRRATGEVGL